MKINISKHACQRALQRARLLLTESERANIDFFLKKDFKTAKLWTNDVPFYKNKLESKYGKGAVMARSKLFEYRGMMSPLGDRILITTVVLILDLKKKG